MRVVVQPDVSQVIGLIAEDTGDDPLVILSESEDVMMRHLARVRHGVFDCDGTLTPNNGWAACAPLMSREAQNEETTERAWFYDQRRLAKPTDPRTEIHETDWWVSRHISEEAHALAEAAWGARSIMRLAAERVTRAQVQAAGSRMKERHGLDALFGEMERRLIVSFGIEEVIRGFLAQYALHADIAAFRLVCNGAGVILSHHPGSVVTSGNKGEAVATYLERRRIPEEHILTVFDNPVVDRGMIRKSGVNVLLMPQQEIDRKLGEFRNAHIEPLWRHGGIDIVLVSNSLMPLVHLLQKARGKT